MKRKLPLLAVVAALLGCAAFWFLTVPETVPASALAAHSPDIANGKEMFEAGGCASCHAVPDKPDKSALGGGLALKSPFGTFYAPNISPDRKDGIGAWSEAEFISALTKGTSPGGEHLYPALPYTSYQRIAPNDLRDMFGGIIKGLRFTGGPAPDGQGGVPNITQFKLKDWTVADIVGTLTDGFTPDADRVGGSMVEVVRNISQLSDADRRAMAVYIKSLSAVRGQTLPEK